MSITNETPVDHTVPANDDERRAWFAPFGYTGDPDEIVVLQGADGKPLKTAPVADVWAVLVGLRRLETDYTGQFHRTGNWAEFGRRPIDPADRLTEAMYGPLTHRQTGDWLPGRREIVCALLERRTDDDTYFRFRDQPLTPFSAEVQDAA